MIGQISNPDFRKENKKAVFKNDERDATTRDENNEMVRWKRHIDGSWTKQLKWKAYSSSQKNFIVYTNETIKVGDNAYMPECDELIIVKEILDDMLVDVHNKKHYTNCDPFQFYYVETIQPNDPTAIGRHWAYDKNP